MFVGRYRGDRGLTHEVEELEAESVSYLVCGRLGLKPRSHEYLVAFVRDGEIPPSMSLDRVLAVAGLIQSMGRRRLPIRKAD